MHSRSVSNKCDVFIWQKNEFVILFGVRIECFFYSVWKMDTWPWPVNQYQHEVLASCHSKYGSCLHFVVRLSVFFCFEVNQVLNLYNTINYVNFLLFFFFYLLAVILHMTVISPSFLVSNQRFPILNYKNDQLPLIITVNFCL